MIRRIVPNFAASDMEAGRRFYAGVLGLQPVMDLGWLVTFAGEGLAAPQLSLVAEGGGGAPVPDVSIEVDDLDALQARLESAGIPIEYGPVLEPWGVRRLFVRDPFGRLVNLLAHA